MFLFYDKYLLIGMDDNFAEVIQHQNEIMQNELIRPEVIKQEIMQKQHG